MNKSLKDLAGQCGLGPLADDLVELAQACVRFDAAEVADEAAIEVGASKLGGAPDLPANTAWPRWRDRPLSFLGQINLDEEPLPAMDALPAGVLLSFFCEVETSGRVHLPSAGDNPANHGGWRVLASPAVALERRSPPAGVDHSPSFRACRLTPRPCVSLPDSHSSSIFDYLTDEELDGYESLLGHSDPDHLQTYKEYGDDPQLLGHPNLEQDRDVLDLCRKATRGLAKTNPVWAPDTADWRLLLQLGSVDQAGMMWSDCGALYFCIPDAALRARDFDAVWLVMQAH